MCGIAGLIWRGQSSNIGEEMTQMLQALKHRGPDSTGYALYRKPSNGEYVMRFKVAEQDDLKTTGKKGGFQIHHDIAERKRAVNARLEELGVEVTSKDEPTDYACRYTFNFDEDPSKLADYIEDIDDVEILSLGHALELVKDLGDAETVSDDYDLDEFQGTHGIGHTRMATESARRTPTGLIPSTTYRWSILASSRTIGPIGASSSAAVTASCPTAIPK